MQKLEYLCLTYVHNPLFVILSSISLENWKICVTHLVAKFTLSHLVARSSLDLHEAIYSPYLYYNSSVLLQKY